MQKINRHYLEVHIAVMLFGGAGIFGKLVHIPAGGIVLGRAFLGALFIFFLKKILQESFLPESKKDIGIFALLGSILAFHWVAFFLSIQLSSVAIGVLTFSTFPIFTTLLEPLVNKEPIKLQNLLLALIAFAGVALVMPSMDFQQQDTQGVLWGIASGISFSFLALISKRMVAQYSSNTVSFYQNGIAALILAPFFTQSILAGTLSDWGYLLVLGIIFTGIAHTLFINSMKSLQAQTASLIASLEPVYGIALAWIVLNEIPTLKMLLGGALILGVAFYATIRNDAE